MVDFTFDNLVSLIIVFVSWLLVVFLLTAKTKNRTSNIILSLFILVNAQDSSGLFASIFVYPKHPGWGMIINNTVFFKMPLLYLYFLSIIYSDFYHHQEYRVTKQIAFFDHSRYGFHSTFLFVDVNWLYRQFTG